jgi:Tfp pilus assembly protein PilF
MLLESGHPADALAAYEAALINDPRRLRSFEGAARAALAAGHPAEARDYYARMVAMADTTSTRPELIKARTYLAK